MFANSSFHFDVPSHWVGDLPVTSRYTAGIALEKFFIALKEEGTFYGARCPACSKEGDKVINTREVEDGNTIKRRRMCLSCGFRFTTYERYEKENLWVIKKDGSREHFQRDKILKGMLKACEKRSIPMAILQDAVSAIERTIQAEYEDEVPSRRIGELVINHLKKIDKVAYVRFASVYREFKDVKEFMDEIKPILKHTTSRRKPKSKVK